MASATTKNLHVPLPAALYRRLRRVAEQQRRPATQVAREAIAMWLSQQHRLSAEDDLRLYVRTMAATADDLDPVLEAASVEHLSKKRRR